MMSAVLPTTDLYFLNSCRTLVRRWWRPGVVRRDGANSFRIGDCRLLIRRDTPAMMQKALEWPGRLIYLIDDDINGAAQSPGLPLPYQERLADFAERYYNLLLKRAETIVTSSDELAATLQSDRRVGANIMRLDPFWASPFADQSHFAMIPGNRLEIVHLGTASHSGGLAKIASIMMGLLDKFPYVRFTFIGVRGSSPALESHPQVRRVSTMSWLRYQRWLPSRRFHLALYPLEDTPFDRARSHNKLVEHAIVGAVGVYPRSWKTSRLPGEGAITASPDASEWGVTIEDAILHRTNLSRRSAIAARALLPLHQPTLQQNFWKRLLRTEDDKSVR